MIFVTSKISDGNMSIFCGDLNQALINKEKFFQKIKINSKNIVELEQIHGNKIIKLDKITSKIKKADGLITDKKDVYLMIKAADCHQIGLFDPKHHATSLIHAGRKGLHSGIIKKAITLMSKHYQTKPVDLLAKFGPSIGPCHYLVDIWKEAENQLISCGLKKEYIDNPKICTYESLDYFSHRRAEDQNMEDFRFATIGGLTDAN